MTTSSTGIVYSFSSNRRGPNQLSVRVGKSPKVIRFDTDEVYELDEQVVVTVTRVGDEGARVSEPEFVSPLDGIRIFD